MVKGKFHLREIEDLDLILEIEKNLLVKVYRDKLQCLLWLITLLNF